MKMEMINPMKVLFLNNQPKTFFGKNNTISSGYTGKNWGKRNKDLENRKTRIKL